jgi:hypothetical protein
MVLPEGFEPSLRSHLELMGYKPTVLPLHYRRDILGAGHGIRTHTVGILSPMPLPIGLRPHCHIKSHWSKQTSASQCDLIWRAVRDLNPQSGCRRPLVYPLTERRNKCFTKLTTIAFATNILRFLLLFVVWTVSLP